MFHMHDLIIPIHIAFINLAMPAHFQYDEWV